MAKCLASGNLQAHYVQGIKQYFRYNNVDAGLPHLKFLRQHCLPNYLYGVIMLSKGETAIGQAMLDTLRWRENKRRADACWRRIKRSLHGITVTTLESYMTNYLNTRATITCH
ncbi:unnamed protein product [Brassica rapa subsp. narinosa]